jgi:environmental stress-induced protein Ves
MNDWQVVSAQDVAPQRWRNDGGWTRELLAWPADDWVLRISVADIEADGPFSAFDGVQRWFGVLQGAGVRLLGTELRAGDGLLRFDGGLAPDCRLIGGPTRDFNLLHRRSQGQMQVQTDPPVRAADWIGVFTAEGGMLNGRIILPPLSLGWAESASVQAFEGRGWWMSWRAEP